MRSSLINSSNWRERVLDRFEQSAALALYLFLVIRIWPDSFSAENIAPALVLLSEGIIIFFLLIRRPAKNISLRISDWLFAVVGTSAPLLVVKSGAPVFLGGGVFLLLFGMVVQLSAKLSLRRSFGLVPANRGVKSEGAYRYVRHPMYLGYIVSHIGFLLVSPSLWNFAVYVVAWCCLVFRIEFEERLLGSDPAYALFREKTRYKLLPGVF